MSFLGLVVGIATAVSTINIFNGPTLDIEQLRFEPTTPLVASFFFIVAIATFAVTLQTKLVKVRVADGHYGLRFGGVLRL